MSTVFINKMVGTEAQASVSTSCPWDYHIQTWVNCISRILDICTLHFTFCIQASVSTSCPWDYHLQTRVKCNSRILNIFILHFAYWILHFSFLRLFEIKWHVNCIYKQNGWNRGASLCFNKLPLRLSHPNMGKVY